MLLSLRILLTLSLIQFLKLSRFVCHERKVFIVFKEFIVYRADICALRLLFQIRFIQFCLLNLLSFNFSIPRGKIIEFRCWATFQVTLIFLAFFQTLECRFKDDQNSLIVLLSFEFACIKIFQLKKQWMIIIITDKAPFSFVEAWFIWVLSKHFCQSNLLFFTSEISKVKFIVFLSDLKRIS